MGEALLIISPLVVVILGVAYPVFFYETHPAGGGMGVTASWERRSRLNDRIGQC